MPWRALPGLGVRACRDQPTLHDFLQEAVLHQAFAVNPAEVVGSEHTSVALLECLEHVKGFSQFFVWRGHEASHPFIGHYKSIVMRKYKYMPLCGCKSIVSYECKYMMLCYYKSILCRMKASI